MQCAHQRTGTSVALAYHMIQIPDDKLKELIVKEGLITASAFDELEKEAQRMGQLLSDILISRGIISHDYFIELLTRYFGVSRANFGNVEIDPKLLRTITEDVARNRHVVVFREEPDGSVAVAMEDPANLETIEFLKRKLQREVRPYLATLQDLNKGFLMYGAERALDFSKIIQDDITSSMRSRARGIAERAAEVPIVAIIDNILTYAISQRASDVHLEMFEDSILLRYRIDGILKEIFRMPREIAPAIIARLKILGGMKIDEHNAPQDGRFRHRIAEEESVDVRIAIMPTFYGEKAVMRLLASSQKPLSLGELGMFDDMMKIVKDNIQKTFGLFLITGPTGSGKTTTLYSILGMLNRPEVNIVTIEDPIEYQMKYVNQTQINPQAGITFASGLRAILRQDPNIIMVGEIRDEETAEISVHSALTGHLVLSSLHTNDAPTAIPRFIDMKIEPFLVSAVLNAVMAQRLVRKICVACVYSYTPEPAMAVLIKKEVADLNLKSDVVLPKVLFKGKGCKVCGGSGYQGRVGIYEILDVNEDIRKLIVSADFTLDALITLARKNGMISMFEDGLRKAEVGLTTIEEVLRVIRE